MKGIAHTCSCGMRVEPGESCPRCSSSAYSPGWCIICGSQLGTGGFCVKCAGRRDEKNRPAYRKGYSDPEYRANRLERYRLVGGRCEVCGIPLKGELHPDGAPWESDHVIELGLPGGTNDVANLRCFCVPHHHAKTKASRRARRRR